MWKIVLNKKMEGRKACTWSIRFNDCFTFRVLSTVSIPSISSGDKSMSGFESVGLVGPWPKSTKKFYNVTEHYPVVTHGLNLTCIKERWIQVFCTLPRRYLFILYPSPPAFIYFAPFPVGIYLFTLNYVNTLTIYEICSKLTIKTT